MKFTYYRIKTPENSYVEFIRRDSTATFTPNKLEAQEYYAEATAVEVKRHLDSLYGGEFTVEEIK